jgi:preprotein translocase subunit SecA
MGNFFDKLMNTEGKQLKAIENKVKPVEALKDQYRAMSDEELKAMTPKLKQKLADGASLDDIMVEAFATAREACWRVIGEYPFFVQLMGACGHAGRRHRRNEDRRRQDPDFRHGGLSECAEGKGVHVVTVNEYLSKRDSEWMGQIHRFLGLSVGLNLRQLTPAQKREAYACDITYTTNAELGFDYLRDNMVTRVQDRVLRGLNFALIDEVDSILIDESRTPLIIRRPEAVGEPVSAGGPLRQAHQGRRGL